MSRYRRVATTTLIVGHAIAVTLAVALFTATATDWIGVAVVSLWASFGVAVGVAVVGFRPRHWGGAEERLMSPRHTPLWKIVGWLPLVEAAVAGIAAGVVIASGGAVNIDYLLVGTGVGGVVTTIVMLPVVAYGGTLLGLIAVLLVWFPIPPIVHTALTWREGRVAGRLASPILLLMVLPMSVSAVLAVDGPGGRGGATGRLLTILGADVARFTVADHGWLWVAHLSTVVLIVSVVVAYADRRRRRPDDPPTRRERRPRPNRRPRRPHGRPTGGRRR